MFPPLTETKIVTILSSNMTVVFVNKSIWRSEVYVLPLFQDVAFSGHGHKELSSALITSHPTIKDVCTQW